MSGRDKASISLRSRNGRNNRPKISAPQAIPQPVQKHPSATSSTTTINVPPSESSRRPSESSRRPSESSRRPSESSRRPSAASGRPPGPDGPAHRPQQRTADRTAEMVKRRYSTRFAQAPDFSGSAHPMVPALPQLADKYASRDGPVGVESIGDEKRLKVDAKALRDPGFRPEKFVAMTLQKASASDIQAFKQELLKVKNRTSTDLQHNVFQNRTQFIKISKEAEGVKGEMRSLRGLISDLTSTMQATSVAAGNTPQDSVVSRKQSHRSSVANLEAMWNTHLQTLWKRVEGSQKYLPAVSGRHIVYESGKWVELNAATWKSKRRVHIILLNDHLLIAIEKKRPDPSQLSEQKQKQGPQSQAQHIARYCWPLRDVSLADISMRGGTGGAPASAINIRVGADSFTYATGAGDAEKATLLATFRKTAEDLRKATETENAERQRIQGPGATSDAETNFLAAREMMGGLLGRREAEMWFQGSEGSGTLSLGININTMLEIEGSQHSLRSIEASLDDLSIAIALHHFEESVEGLEKLRRLAKGIKGHAIAAERVGAAVEARAAKLGAVLVRRLIERHSWENTTKETAAWLGRIGWEDRAREAYLGVRSETIRKRARQSPFTGHLPLYIHTLSFIYFTLIRNTLSLFHSCFSPSHASAVVRWAKMHVEEFNEILTRQLDSVDPSSEVYADCLERAKKHANMLREVGVDWRGLVGGELGEAKVK
ncbi:hypothetical protein P152DRAFT_463435 [Eremomyces bilateralis CBS 781.70]|uniref:Exocyst complex component EXO84 n=1 Tax=Eremomyces bilateralis CBS 781.70 TaxID=1392243 RepID=A0A6G1GGI6_9PEZI|nr:uncharacterized protein P152DRAFT_463435 [Eremomyces bilateralis CBS 781.70]KAF1817178.1 hypothetical protein P152DRAFT_463435 [Eremomyces bilateralis CBS 781.70]